MLWRIFQLLVRDWHSITRPRIFHPSRSVAYLWQSAASSPLLGLSVSSFCSFLYARVVDSRRFLFTLLPPDQVTIPAAQKHFVIIFSLSSFWKVNGIIVFHLGDCHIFEALTQEPELAPALDQVVVSCATSWAVSDREVETKAYQTTAGDAKDSIQTSFLVLPKSMDTAFCFTAKAARGAPLGFGPVQQWKNFCSTTKNPTRNHVHIAK